MKVYLIFIVWPLLFVSCNSSEKQKSLEENSYVKMIEGDDAEMNDAIKKAKMSFNVFDTAFKNGHFEKADFSAKVSVDLGAGNGEHIWTTNIFNKNGSYYGVFDADAVGTDTIKMGDTVKISTDNLSDWLFMDNEKYVGGYTIRVLRNKMSAEEKAEFDSTFRLTIEE